MKLVLTLIVNPENAASERREALDGALAAARSLFGERGLPSGEADWLSDGEALDLPFDADFGTGLRDAVTEALAPFPVDHVVQDAAGRRKQLLVADMDSTMITIECIDELADFAGIKDKVAAVTEAAMRGELDFIAALHERVALLKGLDEAMLQRCYDERVEFTPGGRTLIQTMRGNGALTALVSGGFTFFTGRVATELGFEINRANVLGLRAGKLTGEVIPPISDARTKVDTLIELRTAAGLTPDETMAVGDGANDIPMIQTAGMGVAFRAKPKAEAAARAAIRHGNLTALLYIQGYRRDEFRA